MKCLVMAISLLLLLSGCSEYARLEDVGLGMTVSEVTRQTPCIYKGKTDSQLQYSCMLNVPAGQYYYGRTVRPYILSFENGQLAKIDLDEKELDREALRYRFNHLYHGYGYHGHYGYGYGRYGYGRYGYRGCGY